MIFHLAVLVGYLFVGFVAAQTILHFTSDSLGDDGEEVIAFVMTLLWPIIPPLVACMLFILGIMYLHEKAFEWVRDR